MINKILAFSETELARKILDGLYTGFGIIAIIITIIAIAIEIRSWKKNNHSALF